MKDSVDTDHSAIAESSQTAQTAAPGRTARVWAYSTAEATPTRIALISTSLGATFTLGLLLASLKPAALGGYTQFWLYLALLSAFHMLEFLVTAQYNSNKLTAGSFLLANGPEYIAAQALAFAESLLVQRFAPRMHSWTVFTWLGLTLLLAGQFLRCRAMIDAGSNFSHLIALTRAKDHALVTTGVYGYIRHPSYSGYILWAVGSQLFLGNWVSAAAFAFVLWTFFNERISMEDQLLRTFFGTEHKEYCANVWSGMPGVL